MKQLVVHANEITKVFYSYSHQQVGVEKISLNAKTGELVLLLGPSGSGKTTLLTLIAGFVQPTDGTISLFNRGLAEYSTRDLQKIRATRVGFIFQNFLLIDALTVIENITLVLHFAGNNGYNKKKKAMALLDQFSILHLAKKFPPRLSQGERQRVAIARAIANDADLILADEPTASLAAEQGSEIIHLLHQYAKEHNKCVLVASHDLRLKDYADRVLYLSNGRLIYDK